MNSIVFILILQGFFVSNLIQGQCTDNSTCVCHCDNCTSGCSTCLPGWSGSTSNYCQKSNTLYQLYDNSSESTSLLDGDFDTYVYEDNSPPFVRVHLQNTEEFRQIDITILLENQTNYTVYVKNIAYQRDMTVTCRTFMHNDTRIKKTVTATCYQPLSGSIIEIVASKDPLKVFEIEKFDCSNGTYGENCTGICSAGCNKRCDKQTGDCACKDGFWGSFCTKTCPSYCNQNLCSSDTGDCYNCIPGYYGLKCQNNCSVGCQESCDMKTGLCTCKSEFYSRNCSLHCPSNCLNRECLPDTGYCRSCINGTRGDFCELECFGDCEGQCDIKTGICGKCTRNKYGTHCNKTCSDNCEGNLCGRYTGECFDCVKNKYGFNCSRTCSKNCEAGVCNKHTGKCENCKKGFRGDVCNETCPNNCIYCAQNEYQCNICIDGWYGVTCSIKCPQRCGEKEPCDFVTGNCHVCPAGYYGDTCNEYCSEFCDSSRICNKSTGECQNCKPGRYGKHCSETCSNNCKNFTCFSNQSCAYGCEDGWFGKQCNLQCSAAVPSCDQCEFINSTPVCRHCSDPWYLGGLKCLKCPKSCSSCQSDVKCLECKNNLTYGETCNKSCNNACIKRTCNKAGYCIHGCNNSKYGIMCNRDCPNECMICHNSSVCLECKDGYYGPQCIKCPDNCLNCTDNTTYHRNGGCNSCSKGFYGVDCEKQCTYCINNECDSFDGICKVRCEDEDDENCDAEQQTLALVATIGSSIIVFLGSISVFCLAVGHLKQKWRNRNRPIEQDTAILLLKRTGHCYENTGFSVYNIRGSQALLEEIDPEDNSNEDEIDDIQNPDYINVNMTRITLKQLWEYKLQNTARDILDAEFQNLPTGLLMESKEAQKYENKKRNRYKFVYPYDSNRVLLSTGDERSNNGYINASYINGLEISKEYIATQGPFTDETITDFWEMVWQENINTIVILTNLEENGVVKCKKYWPRTEKMYGNIQVKTLSSQHSSCYKVRCFKIRLENNCRTVEQFHFTAWPDKGVPSTVNSILEFREKIRSKTDMTGPIIVHCSAGIGRTGTFIALDFLIHQGQKEGSVDIVNCVANLRYQRTHLVQTVEQYIYLYGAVTKKLTGNQSGIHENEFMTVYSRMKHTDRSTGKSLVEEEFNLIEKLVPGIDEDRYQTAKAVNNRHINKHGNILADDNFRIYLNRQDSDYINAIALPSAQHKFGYIVTSTPLPESVDDFFSMMADHDVYTIVQLDNDADEVFVTRRRNNNETFTHNTFELNPHEKISFGLSEVLTCHLHDDHALISRAVKLYRGRFWNENHLVPNDFQPMISLVEEILNRRREENKNPVVVVCRDGAQRSGLFCVLANLVEQLQLSGSVDILQTVLNVRHRRPQIVTCLEQLEYIYDFIKKYLESGNKV